MAVATLWMSTSELKAAWSLTLYGPRCRWPLVGAIRGHRQWGSSRPMATAPRQHACVKTIMVPHEQGPRVPRATRIPDVSQSMRCAKRHMHVWRMTRRKQLNAAGAVHGAWCACLARCARDVSSMAARQMSPKNAPRAPRAAHTTLHACLAIPCRSCCALAFAA